jgi:hypothetical protein
MSTNEQGLNTQYCTCNSTRCNPKIPRSGATACWVASLPASSQTVQVSLACSIHLYLFHSSRTPLPCQLLEYSIPMSRLKQLAGLALDVLLSHRSSQGCLGVKSGLLGTLLSPGVVVQIKTLSCYLELLPSLELLLSTRRPARVPKHHPWPDECWPRIFQLLLLPSKAVFNKKIMHA